MNLTTSGTGDLYQYESDESLVWTWRVCDYGWQGWVMIQKAGYDNHFVPENWIMS